jgi:membrane-bound serine protease (ClpP class)
LVILAIVSIFGSSTARAQEDTDARRGDVRIIEVSGLLDAVTADFLLSELDRAEEQGALAVVLQVDSLASVVDEGVYLELATRLSETPVTIAFWVGPSGSAAEGGTAELAGVVDIVGVAGGSRIGATGPARLPDRFGPAFGDATARLADQAIGAQEAIDLGISAGPIVEVSTLPTFLLEIEGYELVSNEDGEQVSNVTQDFLKLPITSRLFHTVASPEITYLFFTGGLALLIFELYTAGVGIAGLVGMGMVVAGTYGLATLPFRTVGVVLLVLSFLALAVDIQTNLPRAYTVIGLVLFVAGTFLLWDGITMSWVTGMVGIVGAVLYAYIGMPTMVRTRFSSPVIGRKWLVGTDGQALTDLSPELPGEVRLGGAKWIATSGSGVIAAGEHITVIATEGVELVVESSSKG